MFFDHENIITFVLNLGAMIVDLFIPCFIDQFYPQTAFNVVKVLEQLEVKVNYNPSQTCCGQVAFNAGNWKEARMLGEKLLREFEGSNYVVCPSASCTHMIRHHYHELFYNTGLHNEYKSLKERIFELTDFLVNVMGVTDLGARFNSSVTYHHSCTANRQYGLKDEALTLLKNVRDIDLKEMKDYDECCGFGGTFSVKFEPVSVALAKQKVENAMASGAEYITSTEASCLLQMESYIKKYSLPLKTIHLMDILVSD